eukprot:gnl/TRDRNA2_/TRDRNA2_175604_c6_seq5.p1 gnl/TRDRNA2_/TRDRNA2_175604_c6~~gnl/TRDRNA2_/TRDRNA2_175604_c6_seq5.p1  ORF type:complete len:145 (+),score=8.22 gnl/TRDRNA2_/TRDRNA2_175604_c6_seq5:23-436(+)
MSHVELADTPLSHAGGRYEEPCARLSDRRECPSCVHELLRPQLLDPAFGGASHSHKKSLIGLPQCRPRPRDVCELLRLERSQPPIRCPSQRQQQPLVKLAHRSERSHCVGEELLVELAHPLLGYLRRCLKALLVRLA